MSFFPIIVIILVIASSVASANKKQKAREAQQRKAQQHRTLNADAQPRPADPRFFDTPDVSSGRPPQNMYVPISGSYAGSMDYASTEGASGSSTEGMQGTSGEGTSAAPVYTASRKAPVTASVKSTMTHVVKPVTESSHHHEESSISGIEPPCAPEPEDINSEDAYAMNEGVKARYSFGFDRSSVVNGLIFSEILAKPKALRR